MTIVIFMSMVGIVALVASLVGLVLAIVPLFAGFVPVLFTERRRGLPDFLARTVVLYDETQLVEEAELVSPQDGLETGVHF